MSESFVPCLNTAEVSLLFSQADGSPAQNTWFVKRGAAWTTDLVTAMCVAFANWWLTGTGSQSYQNHMGSNNSLVEVTGRDLTTENGISVADNSSLPIAGTVSPPTAPLGNTFALTARTGYAGAAYRGRTFLVGMPESAWSSSELNEVSGTWVGEMIDAFAALITAVPAADAEAELVVCSRYHVVVKGQKPVPRANGIMTPVTNYGNHNLSTDFQRRRAPAHNRHRA